MALLSFADLVLDTTEKTILRNSRPIEISKTPLAVLSYFIQHAADGRIVTRDELRTQIWGRKIEDVTIRSSLSILREALGDPVAHPRYVQTRGKEGWRLLPSVSRLPAPQRNLLPSPPGGNYDPSCYMPRPAEEQVLLSCLQTAGRPTVVFGPPGSGKRFLIERTIDIASKSESPQLARALRISIRSALEPPAASLDELLKELGRLVLLASGLTEEIMRRDLEEFWRRPILLTQKFRELMLHLLPSRTLGAKAVPTAIVLYDVGCLASCPFQDDVFNMLRTWQEDPSFDSMRLLIETDLPPRLFPLGGQSPLWTKAHRLDVSRLQLEQIAGLAELHGVRASKQECEHLGELIGWNVYLGRVALFHAAARGMPLAAVLASYQPAQHAFGPFADHLSDLGYELDSLNVSGLLPKLVDMLLRAEEVPFPVDTAWRHLRKGVIAESAIRSRFRFRCPLYSDYFGSCRT